MVCYPPALLKCVNIRSIAVTVAIMCSRSDNFIAIFIKCCEAEIARI